MTAKVKIALSVISSSPLILDLLEKAFDSSHVSWIICFNFCPIVSAIAGRSGLSIAFIEAIGLTAAIQPHPQAFPEQ